MRIVICSVAVILWLPMVVTGELPLPIVDLRIAGNPPLAVQALKEGLRRTLEPDWKDTGKWASQQIQRLRQTEDSKEGVKSFLEKRAAVYVGR